VVNNLVAQKISVISGTFFSAKRVGLMYQL
jgi:hypothetical protein